MRERSVAVGQVVMGGLLVAVGVLLWILLRAWPYAPVFAILLLLGVGIILAGTIGGKTHRKVAQQILGQLACLLILVSVLFPVLWIVGMSMDPRDVLRPLDLSPITNIPVNLLRVIPKRFGLPEQSYVQGLRAISKQQRTANSVDVLGTYHELPEGYTKADVRRPDVWLIGAVLIKWDPLVQLPEGATSLVFPHQVTVLPEGVRIESLLQEHAAIRPPGFIVLGGRSYALPRDWVTLKDLQDPERASRVERRLGQPTLWLLDNHLVHWGILEPFPEGSVITPLSAGEEPACYVLFREEQVENRYSCPHGYKAEVVNESAFWLSDDNFGLCNGGESSTISKGDLGDTSQSPAIWLMGRTVVDWRTSSLRAFAAVINRPTANPVDFLRLLLNSFMLGAGVSLFCILTGTTAAYAFSRFRFPGRQAGMLGFVIVLMMPSVATLAPLYVMLNAIEVGPTLLQIILLALGTAAGVSGLVMVLLRLIRKPEGWRWIILPLVLIAIGVFLDVGALRSLLEGSGEAFNLRDSLLGVGVAMVAGSLPFSIWNMKGFIDTIPKELEEAALIDGASPTQTFFQIMLPLAVPGLAVTALFGFIAGWTEFVLSWQFMTKPSNFTLAMALYNMQGQFASETPWANFAAMSIMVSVPITVVFFALQRYIVGGLTLGAVKG